MDIPLGTVVTHLARGRAKMRNELTEYARERGLVRKAAHLRVLEKSPKGLDDDLETPQRQSGTES